MSPRNLSYHLFNLALYLLSGALDTFFVHDTISCSFAYGDVPIIVEIEEAALLALSL